jgi:hypothetical protein
MIIVNLLLALLGARNGAAGCAAHSALTSGRSFGYNCVVSHTPKLMLCSAPKAASTAMFAILVAHANASDDFRKWSISEGYPDPHSKVGVTVHRYATPISHFLYARRGAWRPPPLPPSLSTRFAREVLSLRSEHRAPTDYLATCADPAWLCVLAVRHPFDRAISSFLHVASTKIASQWPELLKAVGDERRVAAGNYTFREHVAALELTQRRRQQRALMGHQMTPVVGGGYRECISALVDYCAHCRSAQAAPFVVTALL